MLPKWNRLQGVNDGGFQVYGPKLNTGLLVKQFDSPSFDVNGNPITAGECNQQTRQMEASLLLRQRLAIARLDNVEIFTGQVYLPKTNLSVSGSNEKRGARIS